jgi:CRISPR system Cascade subunit CasE
VYFSKLVLNRDKLKFSRLSSIFAGDGYRAHQQIWKLFSKGEKKDRDFIYRRDDANGLPVFYTVSKNIPEDSKGIWSVQSKTYAPKLKAGQELAFQLLANPVRTKKDEKGKAKRHDVVMEAKLKQKESDTAEEEHKPIPVIVQEEGVKWLESRSTANGFSIDTSKISAGSYLKHRYYKKKSENEISFSSIDFSGILTVTDTETFINALYKGIGHAKGFGCGMMMVRKL